MSSIEELIEKDGIYVGLTKGGSMRPMLREGRDTVFISPVVNRLKKYDVPLYRKGESYVLHRIIRVTDDGYVICGDNCLFLEYVKDETLVGVLSGFRRDDKYISMDNFLYLLYTRIWVFLGPVRRFFMRMRGVMHRFYRRIFPKK